MTVLSTSSQARDEIAVQPSPPVTKPAPTGKSPRPGTRRLTPTIIGGTVLLTIGILGGWFFVYSVLLTGFQEHSSQARLYERFRSELANETAPLGAPIPYGHAVAILSSKHGGFGRVVVVEGSNSNQLALGPGHLPSSPLPGQAGDSVVLGRSVSYGAPFTDITRMKRGDLITATTGQGTFIYRVEDVRYLGNRQPPALGAGQSRLTLVTASSRSWPGAWAPSHAVYVDAMLVRGQAQPVFGSLPHVRASMLPMHDDAHALVALILWLGGLVAVAVAAVWGWIRWGQAQTWLIGAPLLLLMLWGASGALTRFLPNLV